MSDELIEELWQIKDSIAREHEYDVDALVAHFRTQERMESRRVVDSACRKRGRGIRCPRKRTDSAPGSRDTGGAGAHCVGTVGITVLRELTGG